MQRDGVARRTACVIIEPERLEAMRQQRGTRQSPLRRSWRCVIPYRIIDEVRRARAAEKRRRIFYRNSVLEDVAEPVDEFAAFCRLCHRLAYASENETRYDRRLRKAFKIRERLGQTQGGIVVLFPKRPKGRWWHTYLRDRRRGQEIERQLLGALKLKFARLRSNRGHALKT